MWCPDSRYDKSTCKNVTDARLGEEFDEETTDGRKCKTTVTMDGNKLVTNQKAQGGGKDALAVRTCICIDFHQCEIWKRISSTYIIYNQGSKFKCNILGLTPSL